MDYEVLENAIRAWAQTEREIRAVVVVGSRAVEGQADTWSDLDIVVFTDRPEVFGADARWIQQLGPAWLTHRDLTGAGDLEWYALFEGRCKADFVFTHAAGHTSLRGLLAASPYRGVFGRGVRVLYDANPGEAAGSMPVALAPPSPMAAPTAQEFEQQVAGTLMGVNKAARLLARGEVWRAQQQINCALKTRLLKMMMWRAAATAEGSVPDTWYGGRYLEAWAGAETMAALPETFSRYDKAELGMALGKTLDLYCRLGRQTAAAWGLTYPELAESKLRAWLSEI
jgi:hypothetical protein